MISRFRLDVEIARQSRLAQAIARGQAEIASGKKILAPSDDPIGAAQVADIRRAEGNEATWRRNIGTATGLAERADSVLTSVATNLDRAKELMLKASSDTSSNSDRAIIAAELSGIAEAITSLRNTRDTRGEPLFRANGGLEIPVGNGLRLAPVLSRNEIFESPVDVLAVISAAATAVAVSDPVTRSAAMSTSLNELDGAAAQVGKARVDQGFIANRLDDINERLESSALDLIDKRSAIEGADIGAVLARLQLNDTNLQASYAIFAKLNKTSLFDLI
jgi:flagellar hook-associated protein 3 FlgL